MRLERNAVAQAFAKNDAIVMRFFDPAKDRIEIVHPTYQALGFTPLFAQYMEGFKFVYLNPV